MTAPAPAAAPGAPDVRDRVAEADLGAMGESPVHATLLRIHWICDRVLPGRVLDIGCGQGIAAVLLARRGLQVTGVDLDPTAIAAARGYLAAEPPEVRDRVRLVQGDFADLPAEEPFDTVILGEILEHLVDPGRLIDCAARQVAPGGRLVVTVPFGIDGPVDHRRTFHLSRPFELIAAAFGVEQVEIPGKWIGLVATRPRDPAELPPREPGVALLSVLEAGFEAIEQDLLDDRERLKARLAALDQRMQRETRDRERRLDDLSRQVTAARDKAREYAERARENAELKPHVRKLAREVAAVRRSASFRLGHAIVLGVKSPARILRLPGAAWAAWRSAGPRPARQARLPAVLRRDEAKARQGLDQLAILMDVPPAGAEPAGAAGHAAPHPARLCYVLNNSLPYTSNGYAIRADGLARGLAAAGIEVVCLTRPGFPLDLKSDLAPGDVPDRDSVDGMEYRRILQPQRRGLAGLDYMRAAAEELTIELGRLRPQWVVAASNHVNALPALIAARRLGIPFVYEVRGLWEVTRLSREPEFAETAGFRVQEFLEAEVARRADHVFTLTGPMRDELVRRGVRAAAISLLPNSCDPQRFAPRPRDAGLADRLAIPPGMPVIGYLGSFVQYEGLDDLVSACGLLRARGEVFRLMLVGSENAARQEQGPITTEIRRLAAENGLADWLILPGRVPYEEVEAYYSLVDIAPFPRKPQPVTEMVSPLKPLEAMAMEKAVVVSSVAALIEMIGDGETGLAFEKGSVASLADVLQRLVADPDLRRRLGRAARAWVARERTWAEMGRRARARLDALAAADPGAAADLRPADPVTERSAKAGESRRTDVKYDLALFSQLNLEYRDKPLVAKPPVYDPASVEERGRKRAATLVAKHGAAGRVLEIGCGRGEVCLSLAVEHGCEAVGVDISTYPQWADAPPQVRLLQADLSAPDAPDIGRFDFIYSNSVFEHVRHPYSMLRKAFDLLRPGGLMFISANLYRGPKASHRYREVFFPWPHLLFTDEVFEEFYVSIGMRPNRPAWVNQLSIADYCNYFDMIGFETKRLTFSRTQIDEAFYQRFADKLERFPRFDLERDFLVAQLVRPA